MTSEGNAMAYLLGARLYDVERVAARTMLSLGQSGGRMRTLSVLLSALAIISSASFAADSATGRDAPASATVTAAQKNFPEFLELLRIPNVAAEPADIQRNAAFLIESFRKRGFDAQLLDNAAHRPMVFAQLGKPRAAARTVLFYAHFDGQPVTPAAWEQKSPFDPVVKARDSNGRWAAVDAARLAQQPFDPELRVFARSASDGRAPILMVLSALDMHEGAHRTPPVNVKGLRDSEEEIGSPSLAEVVTAHRTLFDADALVV